MQPLIQPIQPRKARTSLGGALISALFITAICAIIATALAVRGRLIIHEGELVKSADQSYLNLQNVQDWARYQVNQYLLQWVALQGRTPAQLRPMEWRFQQVTMGNKKVSAQILDAQGRYNLNDLVYTANEPQFVTLLMTVDPQVTQKLAVQIAQAITDWMTKGALDSVYLKESPAYRAPRRQMADATELRLVAGVTAAIYQKIKPYVIALPVKAPSGSGTSQQTSGGQQPVVTNVRTPININSASWPVLMTLDSKLTAVQAQGLEACRKRFNYFTSVGAFTSDCLTPMGLSTLNNLITHSQYYLLESVATEGDLSIHLNSLLMSELLKNNTLKIDIVWQAFY